MIAQDHRNKTREPFGAAFLTRISPKKKLCDLCELWKLGFIQRRHMSRVTCVNFGWITARAKGRVICVNFGGTSLGMPFGATAQGDRAHA